MNLIKAVIDPGAAVARHAHLAIPVPHAMTDALGDREVTLGIRPEECRILPIGEGLPARVDFVEELGSGRIVHVDFGGQTFAAAIHPDIRVLPGERVGLDLPSDKLHVFDGETGRRIDIDHGTAQRETWSARPQAVLS